MPDKWQSQMLLTVAVFDICPTLRISPSWMMMWGAFVCSEAPRWRDGHPGARRAGVLWEWAAWVHACSEVWGLSVLGSLGLVWSHFSGGFAPSLASTWLQSPVGQPTPSAAFCSPPSSCQLGFLSFGLFECQGKLRRTGPARAANHADSERRREASSSFLSGPSAREPGLLLAGLSSLARPIHTSSHLLKFSAESLFSTLISREGSSCAMTRRLSKPVLFTNGRFSCLSQTTLFLLF